MYKFSINSKRELNTCHKDIRTVFNKAITLSDIDFGISEGHRSKERQQELYAQGRTKPGRIVTYVDGIKIMSKHNYYPSMAVDIFAWVDNRVSYEVKDLAYIAGVILSVAKEMRVNMRWGGNWDRDGVIIDDQRFIDLPHFELIE